MKTEKLSILLSCSKHVDHVAFTYSTSNEKRRPSKNGPFKEKRLCLIEFEKIKIKNSMVRLLERVWFKCITFNFDFIGVNMNCLQPSTSDPDETATWLQYTIIIFFFLRHKEVFQKELFGPLIPPNPTAFFHPALFFVNTLHLLFKNYQWPQSVITC